MKGIGEACLLRRMMLVLNLQFMRRVHLRMKIHPQSPILEHAVSPYVQNTTPPRDSKSDSSHSQGPTPLRERERICHPRRQIIKVPGFEGVSVEEFLDDISKSKRKYSYAFS